MTGLAILALGMLIVGALGAYLSNDSQRAITAAPSIPATAPALTTVSDERYLELENRLTQLNERYGQRLHALETKVEQSVAPYEARLSKLENRLEATDNPTGDGLRNSAAVQTPFDARAYEARLSAIENRLQQSQPASQTALRDLENRMGRGYASYDARLRELENRLMQIQIPYEQRIQALEQQLIYASARLDYLSSEMGTLTDNNAVLVQANARLQSDPPAALPPDRAASAPDAAGAGAAALPVAMPSDTTAAVTSKKSDEMPQETPPPTATSMPETAPQIATTSVTDPVPEPPAKETVPPPVPETASGATQAGAEATDMADFAAVAAAPPAIARADAAPTRPGPLNAAPDAINRDDTSAPAGHGDWVINLASYASESIAAHKLADFRRKGVSAVQTAATVKGRTIYRLRVSGFDTRKSAREQAETIRKKLGLKETWITRR